MNKKQLFLRICLYGLILSTLIGSISFLFIYLESNLSHILWRQIQDFPLFNLIITFIWCILGGLIIGFLKSIWGNYPQVAHHTISELKNQQTVNYKPVFKNLTVAFFILVFGAGVGPEAALLSSIVMLSVWQADKLRYLYFNQTDFLALTYGKRITHMLHPTKYLVTYNQENAPTHSNWRAAKKLMNTLFAINGLIAFFVLMKWTDQPSFISKMGDTDWGLRDFLIFIPLIILGVLAGALYNWLKKKMTHWFDFWQDQPVKKALIGSLAIFLIASFLPSLLFSGQTSLGMIPEKFMNYSFILLTLIVLIKLIFLLICLNTGWVGGDIFPIVFSAILFGFSVSQLFPNFDTIFVTATIATTMGLTILASPVGISLFTALFFPIDVLPIILIICLLFIGYGKWTDSKNQTNLAL